MACNLFCRFAAEVSQYSDVTRARIAGITATLMAHGTPPALADGAALKVLAGMVTRQALMLSFEQLFLLFGACFVFALPLLLLMHRGKAAAGAEMAH